MRNIYIIMTITLALFLSACSNGDGSFETSATAKIPVKACETYTAIKVDDILVKEDDNTTVKIVHDANGSKKVCTLVGAAHLIRGVN